MLLKELFLEELTFCHVMNLKNKKEILKFISVALTRTIEHLKYRPILQNLLKRERLGSTALGNGIAIPHARVTDLKHPHCVVITLGEPTLFDPEEPSSTVDSIFGLFVEEKENKQHLNILSGLAEQLKETALRTTLQNARTNAELYAALDTHFNVLI